MGRQSDKDNDIANVPGSATPGFSAEPEDSYDADTELDDRLAAETPNRGEAPDLSLAFTPETLSPMSDQQAINQALTPGERAPAAPSTPPPATPTNPADTLGNYDKGINDEAKARAEVARLEAEERQRQADALDQQAQLKRDQAVQHQMDDLASQEARDKVTALQHQAEESVANFKFHDFMSTRTRGQKLALIIGAGLAGHAGSGKEYNDRIQNLIANDFAQQRAELGSKETLVKMRREGVSNFDEHLRNERARVTLRESKALEAAADEAKVQALRTSNPLVQARADQLSAQLTQAAAIKRQDIQNEIFKGEKLQAESRLLGAVSGSGESRSLAGDQAAAAWLKDHPHDLVGAAQAAKQAGASTKGARKIADKAGKDQAADSATSIFDPVTGKFLGNAKTEVDQRKVTEKLGLNQELLNAAKGLKEHIEKFGAVIPGTDNYADRMAKANTVKVIAGKAYDLGALAKEDMEIVNNTMGGDIRTILGMSAPQTQAILDRITTANRQILNAQGIRPEEPKAKPRPSSYTADHIRSAREALKDPDATLDEKAAAQRIIDDIKARVAKKAEKH